MMAEELPPTLDAYWRDLVVKVLGPAKVAPSVLVEFRRCFYAGAMAGLKIVSEAALAPDGEFEPRMAAVDAELTRFASGLPE